jgi:MFS family permease
LGNRVALYGLITGTFISALGSRVSMVAVPWLVLTTTGNPADMGLVIAAQMVPYLASSVLGTPLADRFGVRASAITSDVVSTLTTAVIAATPNVGLPTILAMSAIAGVVRGAGDRSKHVLLRPAVEAAGFDMKRITAVYSGLTNGCTLVGTSAGGLLILWFGAQGAIWVDAGSYGVATVILVLLVRPQLPERPAAEPYLVALRGGARFLLSDRLLLGMLVMTFSANLVNQAHTSIFVPLWVKEVLRSPAALGTVLGAFALGAVIGNLVFTALAPKLPQYVTFTLALAISGAPRLFVLGLSQDVALVLAVTFVCGFAVAAVNPVFGAMLYERVPKELQTRVFGLVAAVSFAGFPVGGMLGGWAVNGWGLTTAILLGGGVYLIATVVPLARHYRILNKSTERVE